MFHKDEQIWFWVKKFHWLFTYLVKVNSDFRFLNPFILSYPSIVAPQAMRRCKLDQSMQARSILPTPPSLPTTGHPTKERRQMKCWLQMCCRCVSHDTMCLFLSSGSSCFTPSLVIHHYVSSHLPCHLIPAPRNKGKFDIAADAVRGITRRGLL